jgi:hypothetical protein
MNTVVDDMKAGPIFALLNILDMKPGRCTIENERIIKIIVDTVTIKFIKDFIFESGGFSVSAMYPDSNILVRISDVTFKEMTECIKKEADRKISNVIEKEASHEISKVVEKSKADIISDLVVNLKFLPKLEQSKNLCKLIKLIKNEERLWIDCNILSPTTKTSKTAFTWIMDNWGSHVSKARLHHSKSMNIDQCYKVSSMLIPCGKSPTGEPINFMVNMYPARRSFLSASEQFSIFFQISKDTIKNYPRGWSVSICFVITIYSVKLNKWVVFASTALIREGILDWGWHDIKEDSIRKVIIDEQFLILQVECSILDIKVESTDEECVICMTNITTPKQYACSHKICHICYDSWSKVKKSCPVCRQRE